VNGPGRMSIKPEALPAGELPGGLRGDREVGYQPEDGLTKANAPKRERLVSGNAFTKNGTARKYRIEKVDPGGSSQRTGAIKRGRDYPTKAAVERRKYLEGNKKGLHFQKSPGKPRKNKWEGHYREEKARELGGFASVAARPEKNPSAMHAGVQKLCYETRFRGSTCTEWRRP